MEKLIEVTNLCYKDILDQITMTIKKDQFISISGTNKCGKTTLIKILGQLITVKNDVKYYDILKDNQVSLKCIGLILNDNLIPFVKKTVEEELKFILKKLDNQNESVSKQLEEVIEECDLEEVRKEKIDMLSSLDYINFLLAGSICLKPSLLLLDDPIGDLTKEEKCLFLEKLCKIKDRHKCTIIMTTNCLKDTLVTDYLYIMNNGKIILEGEPLSVLKEERILTHLGLELPFMIDLSLKLQFYNVLDEITLDQESMVDALWK